MKYELTATANGTEVKRLIDVDERETDEQVVERFVADWVKDGDVAPVGVTITQRWSVQ